MVTKNEKTQTVVEIIPEISASTKARKSSTALIRTAPKFAGKENLGQPKKHLDIEPEIDDDTSRLRRWLVTE